MKNLQNYGVQELSAKEIKETDGGIIICGIAVASWVVWTVGGLCVGALGLGVYNGYQSTAAAAEEC
jgi:lactobin A/cerein 7B family class IIb bacteriocin